MPCESAGLRRAPSSSPEAGIKGAWPGTQSRPHCPGTPGPGVSEAELRAGTRGLLLPEKGDVSSQTRLHPSTTQDLTLSPFPICDWDPGHLPSLVQRSQREAWVLGPSPCKAGSRLEERPPLGPGWSRFTPMVPASSSTAKCPHLNTN